MTFDELQKTWQSQQTGFKLTIDSDMLLKEVKRNKKYFESVVFRRDVREVGAGLAVFLIFLYFALKLGLWSLLLLALLTLAVVIFLAGDRILQKRRRPQFSESLTGCTENSLAQVNHQIWLLKNVLWWYLLPPGIGTAIFIAHLAWLIREVPGHGLLFLTVYAIAAPLALWGVYRLNQNCVRKQLNPRRQELQQLLTALQNANQPA